MFDQADSLRKLVRTTVQASPVLAPGIPLILLSGGQGGVGVSSLAADLSHELSLLGRRVVVVDANLKQSDLAKRLGITSRQGIRELLNGSRSASEVLEPVGSNVHLLPGNHLRDPLPEINRESVKRLLTELRSLHAYADIVLVDAGHGMSPWVERLWAAAFQILLVTTPEPAALMASYTAVKLAPWGDVDGKIRLVVNRAPDLPTAERYGQRFNETCLQFLGMKVSLEAASIACKATDSEGNRFNGSCAHRRSVRLLAADLVSNVLVVGTRASQENNYGAASQAARLLAKSPTGSEEAS